MGVESDRLPVSINVGESPGDLSEYLVVDADGGIARRGEPAASLGHGGASIVYRALYKGRMTRALKILSPREDLKKSNDEEVFRASFDRETSLLSRITQTRLSKITDHGSLTLEGTEYLYYAMDLVEDGRPFDEVLDDPALTGEQFIEIVDQLLDALEHLHLQRILHLDVKEANVLVRRRNDTFELTLVDLGVAKSLDPVSEEEERELIERTPVSEAVAEKLKDVTMLTTTPRLLREDWKPFAFKPIPYEVLTRMFPSHDLWCVGLLLRLATADTRPLREKLMTELGRDGFEALQTIEGRLLCDVGHEHYRSTTSLRSDWRKLRPGYLAPLNVPELAVGGSGMTSLAIPRGQTLMTPRALSLFDHPLVQRLRHIPQLEFVALIYPGATHTRLVHALGTYDTAKRFVSHLLGDPRFRLMAEPVDVEAALVWALLHDVGHYPLSHMFEDLAAEEVKFDVPRTIPTDDELFWSFVDPDSADAGPFSEYPTRIAHALARSSKGAPSLHEQLVIGSRFGPGVVEALHGIAEPLAHSHAVLAAALSSSIDVDKISYLQDDSRMTGIPYGLAIDLDALLPALRAPDPAAMTAGQPVLAITDKGLPAAEAIVMARYWMLRRVYWHQTNRAVIAMVKWVIRKLLDAGQLRMATYFERHLFSDPKTALARLSHDFERAVKKGEIAGSGLQRNPLPGLLAGNRVIYKALLSISRGWEARTNQIQDALMDKRADELDRLVADVQAAVAELVSTQLADGDIIVDVPQKNRSLLGAPVQVYDELGENPVELDQASPVLAGLRDEFPLHVTKPRVFIHPSVARELDDTGKTTEARRAAMDAVAERCGV